MVNSILETLESLFASCAYGLIMLYVIVMIPAGCGASTQTPVQSLVDQFGRPTVNAAQQLCSEYEASKRGITPGQALDVACQGVDLAAVWIPVIEEASRKGMSRAHERECR